MAKRKKKVRKQNFIIRLQKRPKVKSIRTKIRRQKAVLKKLSRQYLSIRKSEARKLK